MWEKQDRIQAQRSKKEIISENWHAKDYVRDTRQKNLIFLDMQTAKSVVPHAQSIWYALKFSVRVARPNCVASQGGKNTKRHCVN